MSGCGRNEMHSCENRTYVDDDADDDDDNDADEDGDNDFDQDRFDFVPKRAVEWSILKNSFIFFKIWCLSLHLRLERANYLNDTH